MSFGCPQMEAMWSGMTTAWMGWITLIILHDRARARSAGAAACSKPGAADHLHQPGSPAAGGVGEGGYRGAASFSSEDRIRNAGLQWKRCQHSSRLRHGVRTGSSYFCQEQAELERLGRGFRRWLWRFWRLGWLRGNRCPLWSMWRPRMDRRHLMPEPLYLYSNQPVVLSVSVSLTDRAW